MLFVTIAPGYFGVALSCIIYCQTLTVEIEMPFYLCQHRLLNDNDSTLLIFKIVDFSAGTSAVNCVKFIDSRQFTIGSHDGSVSIYDVRNCR